MSSSYLAKKTSNRDQHEEEQQIVDNLGFTGVPVTYENEKMKLVPNSTTATFRVFKAMNYYKADFGKNGSRSKLRNSVICCQSSTCLSFWRAFLHVRFGLLLRNIVCDPSLSGNRCVLHYSFDLCHNIRLSNCKYWEEGLLAGHESQSQCHAIYARGTRARIVSVIHPSFCHSP